MLLLVVKRLANKQFKALKTLTHPNQQLMEAFFKIFSITAFSKLLPQKIYFQNCFLIKYISKYYFKNYS